MIFGSDFKRAVDARVGLEQLERALERAANDDDWWSALVAAGREAGWTRLHRTGAGREREHGFPQAPPAEWVFRVPLEGGVMLEIDGAATSIDLAAVAAAVRRTARHGRTAEAGAMQP
jgi:hypothetical protein